MKTHLTQKQTPPQKKKKTVISASCPRNDDDDDNDNVMQNTRCRAVDRDDDIVIHDTTHGGVEGWEEPSRKACEVEHKIMTNPRRPARHNENGGGGAPT